MKYTCPKCGHTALFYVLRTVWGTIDGNENIITEVWEDLGWDLTCCGQCGYTADYKEFEV